MTDTRNSQTRFPGFQGPNYTMVPDQLFDQLLPELSGAELKVLLYIIRRTFGFKKDEDAISLSQMLQGIMTRQGLPLDRGVGLTKKTLLQALATLKDKNIILTERRRSSERGDEPTVYRLNIIDPLSQEKTTPPLGEKLHQGGGGEITPGPRGKNYPTQQTVLQETVKQQLDDDAAGALEKFGVSSNQAHALTLKYPSELILEKLDIVHYLQSTSSPLVSRNPQGFLIRAIQENYLPVKPKGYKSKIELQREQQKRRDLEEQLNQAQEDRTKAIRAFKENRPPQPIPGTTLDTKTAWDNTLKILERDLSRGNFQTFLKHTVMIGYQDGLAVIASPSQYTAEWLRDRFTSVVANALARVIDQPAEVEFEAVPEMTGPMRDE